MTTRQIDAIARRTDDTYLFLLSDPAELWCGKPGALEKITDIQVDVYMDGGSILVTLPGDTDVMFPRRFGAEDYGPESVVYRGRPYRQLRAFIEGRRAVIEMNDAGVPLLENGVAFE